MSELEIDFEELWYPEDEFLLFPYEQIVKDIEKE